VNEEGIVAEVRDALLQHYRQMRAELLTAIDGLSDEQLTERTLDGWSVKDHLAHIALWDEVRANEIIRISAGHATAWRLDGDQDDAYNKVSYAMRQDWSVEQAKWELATWSQRLLDAIAVATPRGLDPSLYGEAGLVSRHQSQHAGWIKRWRGERGY
jgi:uncharacterized damage-inducible protein DinB